MMRVSACIWRCYGSVCRLSIVSAIFFFCYDNFYRVRLERFTWGILYLRRLYQHFDENWKRTLFRRLYLVACRLCTCAFYVQRIGCTCFAYTCCCVFLLCRDLKMENIMLNEKQKSIKLIGKTSMMMMMIIIVMNRFRGFAAPGGRKWPSPIDLAHRPYNSVRTNVLHCD